MTNLPVQRYDISQSWDWNLQHAPRDNTLVAVDIELAPGNWHWCGVPAASPLGIPAGPLLNAHWILHYARLGFDILTYKTVRSTARACYEPPNLIPTAGTEQLTEAGRELQETTGSSPSWAVSFGMPSITPQEWRADVALAKSRLPKGKVLVVSVVGAADAQSGDSLGTLADDFAKCAIWAMEAGADGVEANFSCPNVTSPDGSLFQQPRDAAKVASRIRDCIGSAPLVLKIGHTNSEDHAARLVAGVGPFVNGLAMTNSISATVRSPAGELRFSGASRGICGDAIRTASLKQVAMFRRQMERQNAPLDITGVGGISTCEHVRQFLDAGATNVGLATAAMLDPEVGRRIRTAWSA